MLRRRSRPGEAVSGELSLIAAAKTAYPDETMIHPWAVRDQIEPMRALNIPSYVTSGSPGDLNTLTQSPVSGVWDRFQIQWGSFAAMG